MVAYVAYLLNSSWADPDFGNTMPSSRHEFTLHSDGKLRRIGFHRATETRVLGQWESPRAGVNEKFNDLTLLLILHTHHTNTLVCVTRGVMLLG